MNLSDVSLEFTVLGSALENWDNFLGVMTNVNSADFFDETTREIFFFIKENYKKDHLPTIDEILESRRLKEKGISPTEILKLQYFSNAYKTDEDVQKLKKFSLWRDFIRKYESFRKKTEKIIEPSSELLQEFVNNCHDLLIGHAQNNFHVVSDLTLSFKDKVLKNREDKLNGTYTDLAIKAPYVRFNGLLKGFGPGHLVIVGARPGGGKSAFLINLANGMIKDGKKAAIFSLEMTNEEIMTRLFALNADIDSRKLSSGDFTKEEGMRLEFVSKQLMEETLILNDTPNQSIEDILLKAKHAVESFSVDVIFIDYLQLMRSKKRHESRYIEVGYISSALKILAKELKIPVIALCQLNRYSEGSSRRPAPHDLRESGSLEQDADAVILLYQPNDPDDYGLDDLEVIVGKNRHGPTGIVKMKFYKPTGRISEIVD